MKTIKYFILPIAVFALIVWCLLDSKSWSFFPFLLEDGKHNMTLVKFLLTIILPVGLIFLVKELRHQSGIYFGNEKKSALLAWTCFYIIGPSCMTFWLIAALGFSFKDWYGSMILSAVFLIVLYFIPKITAKISPSNELEKSNLKGIFLFVGLSVLTVLLGTFVIERNTILFKLLYFAFIVALGEEVLFRGYIQSSFNLYFGKSFSIGAVDVGWGLIFSAILFGLIHSIVHVPPIWPWMLFTFVGGLILGYVREKDGSLLAPIILHFLMDFPLVFMSKV